MFQFLKGQRFVNAYPQEITVLAKAVYLLLTTLLGARTLGEEYVDLIYVNRTGNRLPKLLPRLGFIVSYTLVPYIISKIVKKLKNKEDDWVSEALSNYYKVLDTILNLHVALFYFQESFIRSRNVYLDYAMHLDTTKNPKKCKDETILY